ncbi:MAG: hypothetical protein AB1454_05750 [Candidatus Auribacterota bacterium]
MKKMPERIMALFGIILGIVLSVSSPLIAQDAATIVKDINKGLRDVQSTMFKGDYEQASAQLEQVRVQLDQLKSVDPENNQLNMLENKYEKSLADIERRMGKKSGQAPAVTAPAQAQAKGSSDDKIPASAKRYLTQIDTAIKKAQRVLDSTGPSTADYRVKQARYEMQSADTAWADLGNKYPAAAGHPDAVETKKRMDDMYAGIDAFASGAEQAAQEGAQADAARDAESNAWIEKFNVYLQSGSDKYFISGYTEEAEDMNRRMELYAELSSLFNEYQGASFTEGKSEELERMEKDIAYQLDTFKNELVSAAERYVTETSTDLDRAFEFFQKNDERVQSGDRPLMLDEMVINSITRKIDWVNSLLPGDTRIAELESRFDELKQQQSVWREKMIESTVMRPDAFSGNDAGVIKEKANSVVKAKFPSATILRTNIVSSDWKEERVIEFTDTTRTALQHRVTRSVSVEVAAKTEDTFLYTVYVGKDLRSDGSWSALQGHIMFTDRMLEENVNK